MLVEVASRLMSTLFGVFIQAPYEMLQFDYDERGVFLLWQGSRRCGLFRFFAFPEHCPVGIFLSSQYPKVR
jgi:hypothetical protein